jgi:hypothetical protein
VNRGDSRHKICIKKAFQNKCNKISNLPKINNSDIITKNTIENFLKFPIIFPKGIDKKQKVVYNILRDVMLCRSVSIDAWYAGVAGIVSRRKEWHNILSKAWHDELQKNIFSKGRKHEKDFCFYSGNNHGNVARTCVRIRGYHQ